MARPHSLTGRTLCGLALGLLVVAPSAQALTGREIVEKTDKQNRATDEVTQATMIIVSPAGLRRVRKLTTWTKVKNGDDDWTLIRFLAPADIRGTGLLTLEHGATDEQRIFLPDLRRSKRIAGSNRASAFVGSDFSNYDMRTEDLQNHTYKLLGETEVRGKACFEVEARPKSEETKAQTGYSRRLLYIDKERFIPLEVRFFDRQQKALKTLSIRGYYKVQGFWRSESATMENTQEGSKTILRPSPARKINQGIPDKVFTRRNLERP